MSDNMRIYNAVREVPKEAQKPITAGRLKGMTDINPMWRIKKLTELFGPCGVGWCYSEPRIEFVPGEGPEIICIAHTELQVKESGEWSVAIPGVGGARYVTQESKQIYTDDEAPKKALTDALSVACKALGIGADIYFAEDSTKYTGPQNASADDDDPDVPEAVICERCGKPITGIATKSEAFTAAQIVGKAKLKYGACYCYYCMKALAKAKKNGGAE